MRRPSTPSVLSSRRAMPEAAADARGFTLLEVMVAIAILGLALTVILSAQGGLASSNQSAANLGGAMHYGRCKMEEVEERLLKLGYPEIDDLQSDVSCCGDESGRYRCDTRIEKIELPKPPQNSLGDGGMSMSSGDGGLGGLTSLLGGSGSSSVPGMQLNPAGGGGLNLNMDGGLNSLGSQISQQIPGGTSGLFSMAMGFVYPTMKLMMEAAIRRLTVTVHWKDGSKARDFTLVQYVTNPARGGFASGVVDPNASASAGAAATGAPRTSTGLSTGVTK